MGHDAKWKQPPIAFGTFGLKGEEGVRVVKLAFAAGFRIFDSALAYGNTDIIQSLVRAYDEKSQFQIVSKITADHIASSGVEGSLRILENSLGLKRIDVLLVHSPKHIDHVAVMKELYELKAAGRVRMIGVSNYTRRHLNILESANLRPDVLQIEVHPFLNQSELLKECESQGISVMSYRPLVLGEVVTHPGLAYLADSCNCTIAQMVLRWLIAKGTVPIPSSKDPTHIVDNFNASKVCMTKEVISSLDSLDRGYRTCSDPTWAEFDD